MVDIETEEELKPQLLQNEKLIWVGRPKTGIQFRSSDIYMIPFSLMWGGFAVFWETGVVRAGAPFFFGIFGIPFVFLGVYLIAGRFFADAWVRKRTYYGITDNRGIIKISAFKGKLKSLNMKTLSDISFTEKNDGSGTINHAGDVYPRNYQMSQYMFPGYSGIPKLEMIADVKRVYEKIVELQSK